MGLKDFLNQVADAFADLPHPFYRSNGDVLACLHRPGTEGGARVDRMKRREVECALPNASRRAAATAPPKSKGGKPVQFWLHDEDRRLVRELAAWLAGQGVRSTDSLVIRAALRTARTNAEFLEAYRHAAQLDGRLKPQKNDTTQSHEGMW